MHDGLSTNFRVGRYTCSMAIPAKALKAGVAHIQTRWTPERPTGMTKTELRDYRRGRDALLAEAARLLGGPVIVAEI